MIETTMSAYQLADDAIGLFLEYRDVHGYNEKDAQAAAARDTQDGIDAEIELRANGEISQFDVDSAESARVNGMTYP